jgi:hypothetical protein
MDIDTQKTTDSAVDEMTQGILADAAGMEEAAKAFRQNRPEDLIERVLIECKVYRRAGIRGQYKGTYRGHGFLIGWESQGRAPTMQEILISQVTGRSVPKPPSLIVFCISAKVGGYPTDGLRLTGEVKGTLKDSLITLMTTAEMLFQQAEIKRLMGAAENPVLSTKKKSFSLVVTDD